MQRLIGMLVEVIRELAESEEDARDEAERLRIAEMVLSCAPPELVDFRKALGQVMCRRGEQRVRDEAEQVRGLLATPIERLGFSVRTYHCLKLAHADTLGELAGKTEEQLISIRNFGKRSLCEITDKLGDFEMKLQPNRVLLGDQFGEGLLRAIPDDIGDG